MLECYTAHPLSHCLIQIAGKPTVNMGRQEAENRGGPSMQKPASPAEDWDWDRTGGTQRGGGKEGPAAGRHAHHLL